jgi:hypothetical protein
MNELIASGISPTVSSPTPKRTNAVCSRFLLVFSYKLRWRHIDVSASLVLLVSSYTYIIR